jgi:hypothetical protein
MACLGGAKTIFGKPQGIFVVARLNLSFLVAFAANFLV